MDRQPPRGAFGGQLLTPSDIGDVNRSRVLQAFCDHGPLSRAELAKMAGVTRATIGNIVASLMESGLIEEGEPTQTGHVGKPGRPLWFGERAGLAGAVSIVPGSVVSALVNARGEILDEATGAFDEAAKADEIAAVVRTTLGAALPKKKDGLLGIGVAVPGVCDTRTGSILGSGPVPGIAGTTLFDVLSAKFSLPVLIDNDSRAQALGEKWFGRGKGVASFASIQTGHGIGVGLVMGGVVVRGAHGEAGEAGHTSVSLDGEMCRCGLRGCWETMATLGWLRAQASEAKLPDADEMDAEKLTALAGSDENARALLERYADNIAIGLANISQLLSPGLLILHGDATGGGETFRALVEERTRARVFRHIASGTDVVLSELDHRATVLGAAGLVLSETFHLVA